MKIGTSLCAKPPSCTNNKSATILNRSGDVVCPLMLMAKERFRGELLPCDIPRTRAKWLLGNGAGAGCTYGNECLPRIHSRETPEELRFVQKPKTERFIGLR